MARNRKRLKYTRQQSEKQKLIDSILSKQSRTRPHSTRSSRDEIGDEPNSIWLVNNGGGSYTVYYNSDDDIFGFRFSVISNGSVISDPPPSVYNNFMVSVSDDDDIIGFSITDEVYPSGNNLELLSFNIDSCDGDCIIYSLDDLLFSDSGGFALDIYFDQDSGIMAGCTDPNASNYNPNAIVDDGSCEYEEPSICDGLTEVELWGVTYDIESTTQINLQGHPYLASSIPPEIGCLTNLTSLNLRWNELTGEIPPEIGNLTNLNYLNLQINQLTGEIPSELGNLTNLGYLSLNNNQLGCKTYDSNAYECTELCDGTNGCSGEIPPELFAYKCIDSDDPTNVINYYYGENGLADCEADCDNLEWCVTMPYLNYLNLKINLIFGEIPPEIGNLTNLSYLNLDYNQLTGEIPSEIWELTSLNYLNLTHNQLSGEIHPEIGNLTNLTFLWLGSNQLTGEIPSEIGNLTNLEELYLSWNRLGCYEYDFGVEYGVDGCLIHCDNTTECSGVIPSEIGYLTNLWRLNLNNNQLTGEIPSEIWEMTNLTTLSLDDNQLTGSIPPEIGNLTNLWSLLLYTNQLTGEIPPEIGQLTNLYTLMLFNNQLSGPIPPEIGNLTNLNKLLLENNHFCCLPQEICNVQNYQYLHLWDNNFCEDSHWDCISDYSWSNNGDNPQECLGGCCTCQDPDADNYGEEGECTYACPAMIWCWDYSFETASKCCGYSLVPAADGSIWIWSGCYGNDCPLNGEWIDENGNGIWDDGDYWAGYDEFGNIIDPDDWNHGDSPPNTACTDPTALNCTCYCSQCFDCPNTSGCEGNSILCEENFTGCLYPEPPCDEEEGYLDNNWDILGLITCPYPIDGSDCSYNLEDCCEGDGDYDVIPHPPVPFDCLECRVDTDCERYPRPVPSAGPYVCITNIFNVGVVGCCKTRRTGQIGQQSITY